MIDIKREEFEIAASRLGYNLTMAEYETGEYHYPVTQDAWDLWQEAIEEARQAPSSGEAEPVGIIELSDYVQLGDDAPIPRRKALAETTEGSIQNLPAGTKLFTHPPAKVPEGWKVWETNGSIGNDMIVEHPDGKPRRFFNRQTEPLMFEFLRKLLATPPQEQ